MESLNKHPHDSGYRPSTVSSDSTNSDPNHDESPCCEVIDTAIVFLLDREESLLGYALEECNHLLSEAKNQIEEIEQTLGDEA